MVIAGVGNGNVTEAALNTLAKQAKSGIACVRASRVTTGRVGRNVEVDDYKFGFGAATRLKPVKGPRAAACGAAEAAEQADLQRIFDEYSAENRANERRRE